MPRWPRPAVWALSAGAPQSSQQPYPDQSFTLLDGAQSTRRYNNPTTVSFCTNPSKYNLRWCPFDHPRNHASCAASHHNIAAANMPGISTTSSGFACPIAREAACFNSPGVKVRKPAQECNPTCHGPVHVLQDPARLMRESRAIFAPAAGCVGSMGSLRPAMVPQCSSRAGAVQTAQ